MFKVYKLKVADALEQRLDTMPAFIKEMAQYKTDLASPYMTDSLYINSLVSEAFGRSREEVEAYHIMLAKSTDPAQNKETSQRADSIRTALLGGADYAALAKQYSVDRGSSASGGRMGYITEGRFPYAFEKAAFSLKPGEISEVVESPQGYHILKGGQHRPARGTVLVEHIMKMSRPDASPEEAAAAKQKIDSIYAAVKADPGKFEDLARQHSDDPGSARQGGRLSWFGAGMMVEPFDSAAFAIGKDEISAPFRSQFGWHIVKKLDAKAPATLEEMKPSILKRMASPQDERALMIRRDMLAKLASKHKAKLNDKNIDAICADVAQAELDSAWYAKASDRKGFGGLEVAKIGKKAIPLAEAIGYGTQQTIPNGEIASQQIRALIGSYFDKRLIETEQDWLYANEPDYRNLLNEYREGSLLYEASLLAVWDKAAKDTEGLNDYFERHRADYHWQKPHVKGILVQAANDSVADAVRQRLATLKNGDDADFKAARKQFAGKASLDRILMEQGQNAMVDNVVFGGEPVKPSNKRYTTYFVWEPRMLDAPEILDDVKGLSLIHI